MAGVEAESAVPGIRVALAAGDAEVTIGGGDALRLTGVGGAPAVEVAVGRTAVLLPAGGAVAVRVDGRTVATTASLEVAPADPDGLIRVSGRDYRGGLTVLPVPQGLLAINRVSLEEYLAGVVNAEMGRRGPGEDAALEAQAIVSRTYALRAIGRWRARAYDVVATVSDQAYGGVGAETAGGRDAVLTTRGAVLTHEGQPIEAFFHSTCGGRTAAGEEVFSGGGLPYLRSASDAGPGGESWCALSPRFRWSESWAGEGLRAALRAALAAAGQSNGDPGDVRDVVVTGRTPSGRVQSLGLATARGTVPVTGPSVRQALPPAPGQLLRSAAFELQITREGSQSVRMVLSGRGAGHGVGLCQWGAVGRARAGATREQILMAYFPGTRLERRW
ncbi:MAG: SpoIID/LytB domain-containing protein [Gemmatimonadota bacterium]|nr:SpoIID/LytB domain-containing protein [Gemmatimonadota bacterium]